VWENGVCYFHDNAKFTITPASTPTPTQSTNYGFVINGKIINPKVIVISGKLMLPVKSVIEI